VSTGFQTVNRTYFLLFVLYSSFRGFILGTVSSPTCLNLDSYHGYDRLHSKHKMEYPTISLPNRKDMIV